MGSWMCSAQSPGPAQPPRVLGDEEGDLGPQEAPQGTTVRLGLKQERAQLWFPSGVEDRCACSVTQNQWCVQHQLEMERQVSRLVGGLG